SASFKAAAAVLLRPAVSLHHSIDGDLRGGRQFHDRSSLLTGSCRRAIRPDRGADLMGRSAMAASTLTMGSGRDRVAFPGVGLLPQRRGLAQAGPPRWPESLSLVRGHPPDIPDACHRSVPKLPG